ncbi:MAG TPA: RodZ domain-containing protein [Anaerolineales bacterium]|nr:RodZ domain-containing protein [Anaerolineales bacterium]
MTQTIGQRLKAEREEQHLTLEKVFEATRIRVQYLQALEADDLSVMPSPVQARGYLRNYAEYLGLDVDRILDELRAAHAQPAPTEVIGPADETSPIPQQDNKPLEPQSETPVLEVSDAVEDQPVPVEELDSSPGVTIPIKPKSARRKKADSSPQPATAEPPTRRRGRKKDDPRPEIIPVVEVQPDVQGPADDGALAPSAEPVPQVEPIPEPESIEETSVAVEVAPEPVVEEPVSVQEETPEPMNASDTLWQKWLNRIGSVLSARMKRRTLVPKEVPVGENELVEPVVVSTAPDISESEVQNLPLENSNEILKEIGNELRNRRELLSLHLDEVERNTHVKAHYLSALERGALDELPSTVQTRGMLSNYATFLDLDVDTLLLRFADALQARHRERNPQKPVRKPGQPIIANIPPVRSFIAGDMIFGVGMAILLVGFAIWGVSRVMTIQSEREVKPTAPSISDILLASPDPSSYTATPTFLPVEAFPGEATVTVEIPTQNANADVQLNLVAVERTYMRVVVDGKVAFDGRVVPGNAYPFEAEDQIEVLVGSGAAMRIVYNGRDLGLMGTFGQVLNNIYTGTEILTPTAMPTATGTITPTPTNTVPPTATSRFTATPVPSATSVP